MVLHNRWFCVENGSANKPSVLLIHGFPSQVSHTYTAVSCKRTSFLQRPPPVYNCIIPVSWYQAYSYRKVLPILSNKYHAIAFDWIGMLSICMLQFVDLLMIFNLSQDLDFRTNLNPDMASITHWMVIAIIYFLYNLPFSLCPLTGVEKHKFYGPISSFLQTMYRLLSHSWMDSLLIRSH